MRDDARPHRLRRRRWRQHEREFCNSDRHDIYNNHNYDDYDDLDR